MSLFSKLSYLSRTRKLKTFNEIFCPTEQMKILDIGAEINPNGNRGLQLIDSYLWKRNISAVNISPQYVANIKKQYPQINAVVADACELPWPNKHFDIVYSNAVIEHIGNFERQKRMINEIMRVGKRWFLATPNRWYPFEFHLRLPFVTWLPGNAYLLIARIIYYNHTYKKYTLGNNATELRLMTSKELKSCFKDSRIIKQRVTFMPEVLIVVGGSA